MLLSDASFRAILQLHPPALGSLQLSIAPGEKTSMHVIITIVRHSSADVCLVEPKPRKPLCGLNIEDKCVPGPPASWLRPPGIFWAASRRGFILHVMLSPPGACCLCLWTR